MKKEPILYGIIGLFAGIVLSGVFATYAVNNNHPGIMNMMGIKSNRVMSGNIDRSFIEQMIPHHESAIAMAKLAQQKASHAEIKTLAGNIITSQTGEINTMKKWYKDWYGADVPTLIGTSMWGGQMMNNQAGTDSLNAATDFDKTFLSQMIGHHQMAVMMANMLSVATNRTEMKKLASDITTAQTKEINDMELWQQQWGYASLSGSSSGMMNMMGH